MMNDNTPKVITALHLGLETTEELVISKKKKEENLPYKAWGSGETKKLKDGTMVETHDVIEVVMDMSSDEKYCFTMLYNKTKTASYFDNNIFYTEYVQKVSNLSKQESKRFLNGYKKLSAKDLVKRVKRGYYMISPLLLIDTSPNKKLHMDVWTSGKVGKTLDKVAEEYVKPITYCTCPHFVQGIIERDDKVYCYSCELEKKPVVADIPKEELIRLLKNADADESDIYSSSYSELLRWCNHLKLIKD